jgi:hypothetical protein
VADVTELQLPDACCDVIFSNWLLMYLSDAEVAALANNMLRWVSGGGCHAAPAAGCRAGRPARLGGRAASRAGCAGRWLPGRAACAPGREGSQQGRLRRALALLGGAARPPPPPSLPPFLLHARTHARLFPPHPTPPHPTPPHPTPPQLAPGGVVFFRESCFRQSGDKARKANPTHYRNPREYFRWARGRGRVVQQGRGAWRRGRRRPQLGRGSAAHPAPPRSQGMARQLSRATPRPLARAGSTTAPRWPRARGGRRSWSWTRASASTPTCASSATRTRSAGSGGRWAAAALADLSALAGGAGGAGAWPLGRGPAPPARRSPAAPL